MLGLRRQQHERQTRITAVN